MTYVVDASVAVKWFVREDLHDEAARMLDEPPELHAPDWIVLEVAHAALRKWRGGEIESEHTKMMVQALPGFMTQLHRSADLTARALAIAMAIRHPVYDCLYLACAEATGGVLITADKKLCDAVDRTDFESRVRYLGDPDFIQGRP